MTDGFNTARYLAETLDRERVYRAYWRNTLTSAISEIVFHDPPIVTWQIVDHHDDGKIVAGDASFSTSVLEAAKRRAAQNEQTLSDKVAVLATEVRMKLADEDERGDGDIVQDDPDTQRIEQQMWDTARALQVQEDEQQPTPPGYRRGLTEAEARARALQIAQDEELLTSPAADKARELKRIDDILTDAWRDARDYQQLSDYQDEAAPHAYEALDGLINAVRLIVKHL